MKWLKQQKTLIMKNTDRLNYVKQDVSENIDMCQVFWY